MDKNWIMKYMYIKIKNKILRVQLVAKTIKVVVN